MQPAVRLDGEVHRVLDRCFIGDIATHEAGLATRGGDGFDGLVAIGDIGDDNRRTLGGEALSTHPAKTRRRTSNNGNFSCKTTHGVTR